MKLHTKVLLGLLVGLLAGAGVQAWLPAKPWDGGRWERAEGGIRLVAAPEGTPVAKARLRPGTVVTAARVGRAGTAEERTIPLAGAPDFSPVLESASPGEVVRLVLAGGGEKLLTLALDPSSPRARAVAPLDFGADLFLLLLKMLIVPLVLTSIVAGVASVADLASLRRLGIKTFAYYISTSLLAILAGQVLVSVVRPGEGAQLGLQTIAPEDLVPEGNFADILLRMVPDNIVRALSDNANMLQVIFFGLLFGFFITRTPAPHGPRVRDLFESLFAVMLRLAEGVLALLPYGVFFLIARVTAETGFSAFRPLLLYMAVVAGALLFHACVTLPALLKLVGGISPIRWAKAMAPALLTAFSTSSSSMTLPITLETVEKRGRVSNRVTSFTLPLGATINMDGTALYECVGVIFLAQYYASTGAFELTLTKQILVVMMALLASIGAAGIPSAGLVMMLTILSALGLPLEGAALLLAVDRPLDMMRTTVNVWSDSCGAAVIARTEGETGPLEAGTP